MARNRHTQNNGFVLWSLEELVPQDHLVRQLEDNIDWDFIYEICDPLYSNTGTNRVDPVVLFKMMFINIIFGIHSMRKTCNEVEVNVAYRWFLGLNFNEKVPDHSTFSQNYIRKFKKNNTAILIFEHLIKQLIEDEIVDPSVVFIDGTHLKANANKNKYTSEEVIVAAKRYQAELDKEIDDDRAQHYKKQLKRKKKECPDTKVIKKSLSDPDCGYFHKGEKEKCFAYNVNTASDKNGYVLGMSVDPGNVHDSVAFFHVKDHLDYLHTDMINTFVADAGYSTPAISHCVLSEGKELIVPRKRNAAKKKGFYKKYQYTYNSEGDFYVCPLGCVIPYSTTTKEGKRQYKSIGKQCASCPNKSRCTESKNNTKVIERHVWEEYKEQAINKRFSEDGKEIYEQRKQTIERVFADGKRRHGLDYTLYTGYEAVYDHTILVYAGMNMKKLCTHKKRCRDKYAQKQGILKKSNKLLVV